MKHTEPYMEKSAVWLAKLSLAEKSLSETAGDYDFKVHLDFLTVFSEFYANYFKYK